LLPWANQPSASSRASGRGREESSGLGDLEKDLGGGSLEQDAENLAVKEGEQELQNVAGQGVASDVEKELGGTQGIEQDINKEL
jgi:hypothetical protein